MGNMSSVVKQHDYKALSTKNVDPFCNCKNKVNYPLDCNCLQTCKRLIPLEIKTVAITVVPLMENLDLCTKIAEVHSIIDITNKTKLSKHLPTTRPEAYLSGTHVGSIFCNHFEELETVLFEVELIIKNVPLNIRLPKYYQNMFHTHSFVIWQSAIIFF